MMVFFDVQRDSLTRGYHMHVSYYGSPPPCCLSLRVPRTLNCVSKEPWKFLCTEDVPAIKSIK